ncbi:MAG: hypothetical protein ABI912_01960 [Actinomycetota bacterium]
MSISSEIGKRRTGDALAVVTVALLAAALIAVFRAPEVDLANNLVSAAGFIVAFGAVGWLLVHRLPDNPIGWCFSIAGIIWALGGLAHGIASIAIQTSANPGPLVRAAAVLDVNGWILAMPFSVSLPLLLLPSGRLLSPRWRPAVTLTLVATALGTLGFAIEPGLLGDPPYTHLVNPMGVPQLRWLATSASVFGGVIVMLSLVAGAVAVIMRFRRSHGIERQQLSWVVFGGCLAIVGTAISAVGPPDTTTGIAGVVRGIGVVGGISAVPICVGIAVLRYRLYDLGRVVSRTASFVAVSSLLLAVYLVCVTATLRLLPDTSSDWAVAGSTLAATALFRPVRRRVQSVVERRFNRAHYDADRIAAAFSRRLRNEVELGVVRSDLLDVVHTTLEPATATLWLRERT